MDRSAIPRAPGPARALLVVAAAVLTAACGRAPDGPRDVLLITIDTARADRFHRPETLTPRIDALADAGARFTQAISPAPLTLPAHATLMTGRQPPSHTVRDNGTFRLPDSETTLAEILSGAGFDTAAFVGAQVLDAKYGLAQGFGSYDDDIPDPAGSPFLYYGERSGDEVVGRARAWLDAHGREDAPVFVWVHLFDPHAPYHAPEPERSRWPSPYDAEIAYADRVAGELLDAWEERRGLDRTLVVVTSDHGESLGDHGEATHGVLVHDATLRVPLVLRGPGVPPGAVIDAPVHLVDVLPTVLGRLGLPGPPTLEGRDLGPLLDGGSLAWSSVAGYAESLYARLHHGTAPLVALREDGWKLVRGTRDELYALGPDPDENADVAAREPERARRMGDTLDRLLAELGGDEAERVAPDAEARRALAALGYAAWSAPEPGPGAEPRDPLEALESMRRMAEADRRVVAGDVDGAVAGYRAVIEHEPASVDARVRLAQILSTAGRQDEAVPLLAEAVALAPQEPELHARLGYALEKSGRTERALAAYDAGLALHPSARSLRDGRWRCLNRLRRLDELLAEAERAVAADPTDGMARFARAVACCGATDAGYVAALERELRALPGDPTLTAALAEARAGTSGGGTP